MLHINMLHITRSALLVATLFAAVTVVPAQDIGREVSIPRHLSDGDEFRIPLAALLDHGGALFSANWTGQEGGGRPQTKGVGTPLSDPASPLVFPRNFNRLSAPDANSCAGCHNAPFGMPGGGGDFVTNVFVLAHRFDFATFDNADPLPTRGCADERGRFVTIDQMANSRATLGMFGAGFIEMLARQITADLRAARDTLQPGGAVELRSKGISYGVLARNADGTWDTSRVTGLAAPSLASGGVANPPDLIVRPFHQAGAVVSLRQFSNNAYNHHHGIQSTERFGSNDVDADGFGDEISIADITAVSVFQATLPVPGRVIPRNREIERAVLRGEHLFQGIGCASCHVPSLPLDARGWVYSEPNPFNPPGNLRLGDAYVRDNGTLSVDLTRGDLPSPRLRDRRGVVEVPAYTDLKLHDITSGPDDPNREALDMHQPAGSNAFFAGNSRFLTRKLWGVANEPPYFHHGRFATMREAIEAHAGEAAPVTAQYRALAASDQDCIVEFLKTLQVLPPGTRARIVDEHYRPRPWHGLQ